MSQKPYLIFDAGGTLVFPNYRLTAQIACENGLEVTDEDLAAAHAHLFLEFDQFVAKERRFPSIRYYPDLFQRLTEDKEQAREAAEAVLKFDRQRSLWTSTSSWVCEALTLLAERGYRMSVISNSDGRVETILEDLELRQHFEIVIDSHLVGVEKPDAKIFNLALDQLELKPQEALYIGDIYYVDVWGANQAGLGAVHLDQKGLYQGWAGAHLPTIAALPAWLDQLDGQNHSEILFPARGFEIQN